MRQMAHFRRQPRDLELLKHLTGVLNTEDNGQRGWFTWITPSGRRYTKGRRFTPGRTAVARPGPILGNRHRKETRW